MITLYELHWSHYCEKIRWALDFKKLPWKKINISAFSKKEMQKHPKGHERYLVPFIYDESTNMALGESSAIMRYLEETYPEQPLFPSDASKKELIYQWLIDLDSRLGIAGRRLGYSQLILENPSILSALFLPKVWSGFFTLPGIRRVAGICLSMLLIKRFRFDLNESLNLYEEVEQYLLPIAKKLNSQTYLVGDTFTAVDLTLAVYLRPFTIIPFFKEHSGLANLFHWQEQLLKEHNRETEMLYATLIEKHRANNLPVRRKIRRITNRSEFFSDLSQEYKKKDTAFNDHEPIWTWRMLLVPYYYFIKIRQNKMLQRLASVDVR
jgi:glutathione S-transferase